MRLFIIILACVVFPAWSEAQVALPRHDAVISIGWAGSEVGLTDYDRWRASLFLGVSGGHYWTEHLKTEVEAGWHNPADSETYEELVIGSLRTSARSTYRIGEVRLAVGQVYQFGSNSWVHPYVGAGTDVIRRSVALDRPAQTGFAYNAQPGQTSRRVAIPALRTDTTSTLDLPAIFRTS